MTNHAFDVGSPVVLGKIYGRIVAISGGLYTFATPHGTQIELGFAYLARDGRRITSKSDKDKLSHFEEVAAMDGAKTYGGIMQNVATTDPRNDQ